MEGQAPGSESVHQALERYEDLWRQPDAPSLERFWAEVGPMHSLTLLGDLVKVDLRQRFARGERPTAAEYLARLEELAGSSERAVSLIYEEFCLLEEKGQAPEAEAFCDRYEPWRDSLHSQLVYHRQLSQAAGVEAPKTNYPREGERFARYQLRSILGTGGAAQVYLATDDDLEGREVALKLSASIGREPSILAKLNHPNIVPILDVTRSEEGLHGFSMPYRPGMTLEALIRQLGAGGPPRSARVVWEAILAPERLGDGGVEAPRPGWADFPISGTYPEAVAWIGLAMANALAYLHHSKGILHRDIKPANVLMSYSEGPQLLDFNLSHAPSAPAHAQAAMKGGTLPYMAPEQLRAFLDSAFWPEVGPRADIYALGLVLRCLLTGRRPVVPNPNLPLARAIQALHDHRSEPLTSIRDLNPSVPPSLESILEKCLRFHPEERYESATDLAEDLQRFLDRRPLEFAENTSVPERMVNYLFRNRLTVAALVLALLSAAAARTVVEYFTAPRTVVKYFTPPPTDLSETDRRTLQNLTERLDPGNPDRLEQARAEIHQVSRNYPDLARPRLHEAIVLELLGRLPNAPPGRLEEARRILAEAVGKPDFAEALMRMLDEHLWLARRLASEEDPFGTPVEGSILGDACRILRASVESGPENYRKVGHLASIERSLKHDDKAIQYFARALEIMKRDPNPHPEGQVESRKALLPLLIRLADIQLDPDKSPPNLRRAGETLQEVEVVLAELGDAWAHKAKRNPEEERFFQDFYRAAIESGRAMLAASFGESDKALAGFERAKQHFKDVLPRANQSAVIESIEFRLAQIDSRTRILLERPPDPGPTPLSPN